MEKHSTIFAKNIHANPKFTVQSFIEENTLFNISFYSVPTLDVFTKTSCH